MLLAPPTHPGARAGSPLPRSLLPPSFRAAASSSPRLAPLGYKPLVKSSLEPPRSPCHPALTVHSWATATLPTDMTREGQGCFSCSSRLLAASGTQWPLHERSLNTCMRGEHPPGGGVASKDRALTGCPSEHGEEAGRTVLEHVSWEDLLSPLEGAGRSCQECLGRRRSRAISQRSETSPRRPQAPH